MTISWDELWMETAVLVGKRSKCTRAQYGAVIVSADNRILSIGYNGPPWGMKAEGPCTNWCERSSNASLGLEVDPHYRDCPAIHAEQNAIMRATNLWLEHDPVMYINGVTCLRCVLVVANSGIKSVVLLNTEYEQKRNPEKTVELLESYNLKVRLLACH